MLFFVLSSFAQDIHFVQFQNTPLNLNPALTGMFGGDIRASVVGRNQWNSVPVGYKTITASVESKFFNDRVDNAFFSGGVILFHDWSGDSGLGRTNIGLSGSYTQKLNENNLLTAGVKFSMQQLRYNSTNLTFGDQYDGDQFNSSTQTTDPLGRLNSSKMYPDIGGGINWHHQVPAKRTRFDVGAALFHINKPEQLLSNGQSQDLFMRVSAYALANIKIAEKWDAVGFLSNQIQGPHEERLAGVGAKYIIRNDSPGTQLAIQLAGFFRFNDESEAWIPALQVEYGYWTLGATYDLNVSDFQVATDRRGGPELSATYRLTKVRSNAEKICPVY